MKLRGLPCGDGKVVIGADVIEGQVEEIVKSLRLPDSWRNEVVLYLSASSERQRLAMERQRLEDRKQRLWRAYLDGMPESEYRRELAAIEASLKAGRDTGEEEVLLLGDHVEGMLGAWQHATKEEKRDLLRMMPDGIYVDTGIKKVAALQVEPAFKPLFRVC